MLDERDRAVAAATAAAVDIAVLRWSWPALAARTTRADVRVYGHYAGWLLLTSCPLPSSLSPLSVSTASPATVSQVGLAADSKVSSSPRLSSSKHVL